jgi:DNA-binding LacI/PurR family transcriptional regulator
MGRVTLQSIADRTGVSRMTVSNAFSRPDQLSPELRERILATAAELGYVGPDPAARALAKGRVGAVGLLLTETLSEAFQDAVATDFVAAVGDSLAERGLALTVLGPNAGGGVVFPRDVAMDGALVYVCGPASADLQWLTRRGLPMVGVDQPPAPGLTTINIDDRAGARAAAEHLLDLDHRRIGVLTLGPGPDVEPASWPDVGVHSLPAEERLAGWRDALDASGVVPTVVLSPFQPPDAAYAAARLMLDRPERPTAVLCFSDAFAAQVLRAARDLGLRVPDDLSVVGFDDSPVAAHLDPPLSTVRQDIAAKARLAVGSLLDAIAADREGEPARAESVVLRTELVVRGSTGAAPAG